MSKYKFEEEENAIAAHEEIVQSGWGSAIEIKDQYIYIKTKDLTPDLVLDIEKIIKKHGGKAVFVSSLA